MDKYQEQLDDFNWSIEFQLPDGTTQNMGVQLRPKVIKHKGFSYTIYTLEENKELEQQVKSTLKYLGLWEELINE